MVCETGFQLCGPSSPLATGKLLVEACGVMALQVCVTRPALKCPVLVELLKCEFQ